MAVLVLAVLAGAHPLGNLSVNHFTRIQPGEHGVNVTYVLDLGEMPVFELMNAWHVNRTALEQAAPAHVGRWVANLSFRENGKELQPEVRSAKFETTESPGDLATMRITLQLRIPAASGRLEFADNNYAARTGWREIAITPGPGAEIARASNGSGGRSNELRDIPEDTAPLNGSTAWMEWRPAPGLPAQKTPPVIVAPPPAVPERAAIAPESAAVTHPPQAALHSDAISTILRRKTVSLPLLAALLALAFWFGALHALEPGHGKTMVAAYLVGARGTPKHAALLGASVTFTHTASVFLLGIATLFVSRYVMPDRISRVLGIASGVSIFCIGAMLFWRRLRSMQAANQGSEHEHAHAAHAHAAHAHTHEHGHEHHYPPHTHDHAFTHTHDGHTHTHAPEGDISVRGLIALGASGGLVPCPSALVLLLTAISLGRTGLGLILLCAFSAGLAIVLTATGMAVLYAKRLIPENRRSSHPAFRYMPVFSAAVIVAIGALMTGVSIGWIPANRFIG